MTPVKKHVSLKAMAEDKDLDAVGKVTNFLVDPALIKVRPGFNPRPINRDHVEEMYTSYVAGASFDPIVADVEGGEVFVVAGHHRREMYLLARERGHDIKRVEVRPFKGTEAERVALTITSQQGLALTPLQLGNQYAKLLAMGWTLQEVANRIGKSGQHVRDCLALTEADPKAKAMLEKGQVSADVVRTAIRQHGADAGAVLEADLKQAKADGKDKVTPKTASAKPLTKAQRMINLLERMRDIVLHGAVADEALEAEYVALMGEKK
jgi:ParB family chromosome partitioning protein